MCLSLRGKDIRARARSELSPLAVSLLDKKDVMRTETKAKASHGIAVKLRDEGPPIIGTGYTTTALNDPAIATPNATTSTLLKRAARFRSVEGCPHPDRYRGF